MNATTQDPVSLQKAEKTIEACNNLLKGEISAVETYGKAIDKFNDEPEIPVLRAIREEHEKAAGLLRNHVLELHGLPETGSGAWGAITGAIQSTVNFFGEGAAVKSLEQGEMLGQKGYADMLEDEEILPAVKRTVRDLLLPMVNRHIKRLEDMENRIS